MPEVVSSITRRLIDGYYSWKEAAYQSKEERFERYDQNGRPLLEVYEDWGDAADGQEEKAFPANAALPQEMKYIVPRNHVAGQRLSIEGPHGPMLVDVPAGKLAGDEVTFRFGPPPSHSYSVTVPREAKAGDKIKFEAGLGVLEALVPEGKQAGDIFHVIPRAMMVQVPESAKAGDKVTFSGPDGRKLEAVIPEDVMPGNYFAAAY